jgi:hypothetical protein
MLFWLAEVAGQTTSGGRYPAKRISQIPENNLILTNMAVRCKQRSEGITAPTVIEPRKQANVTQMGLRVA